MLIGTVTKLKLIARCLGNWDYYLSAPFSDGSQAILYIAKPGSGAGSGVWCSVSRLRRHLSMLREICNGSRLIPSDWEVIDKEFFEQLGIETD